MIIKNIEEKLQNLNLKQIKRNDVKSFDCNSPIPFKTFDFINGLLYRIDDLSNSSYKLIKENEFTSSILLVKSLIENIAVLWHLSMKIESLTFTKNIQSFENEFKKILFENREVELISIVDNFIAGKDTLKSSYRFILEYSYANFTGTHALYSKMNMEEFYIEYGKDINEDKINTHEQLLFALENFLEVIEPINKNIEENKEKFIELF